MWINYIDTVIKLLFFHDYCVILIFSLMSFYSYSIYSSSSEPNCLKLLTLTPFDNGLKSETNCHIHHGLCRFNVDWIYQENWAQIWTWYSLGNQVLFQYIKTIFPVIEFLSVLRHLYLCNGNLPSISKMCFYIETTLSILNIFKVRDRNKFGEKWLSASQPRVQIIRLKQSYSLV